MDNIYELYQKDKIIGEIYIITNIINNKVYIGQTVSHRKNKGKYRPFGFNGRFNDHISEAINNTKKNQCTYLNNSIRKHGRDAFSVKLIEMCKLNELDNREKFHINNSNSLFPHGYNLTKGGKTLKHVNVINNENLNDYKKRGRQFGYKHNDQTKEKMSKRLKNICSNNVIKERMKSTMKNYYDTNKIKILETYNLDYNLEKYIKPVKKKNTDEIYDYVIKINGRKLRLYTQETIEQKYTRLINILSQAKNNQQVKIVEMRESKMENPQPLS